MFNSNQTVYIEANEHANLMADYLEAQGFKYGYSRSGPCQRRAGSNMPFIVVDQDRMMYHGTKGKEIGKKWHKITEQDVIDMRGELIASGDMQPKTEQEIHDKFVSMFGVKGLEKVFDGFGLGTSYKHFGQVRGRHREVVVNRMKQAIHNDINLSNHRRVMSKDESRVERVWVSADGREKPISRMDDDHLNNTILYIDRKMAEGVWRLGMNEDLTGLLAEMEEERIRRGMPLPLFSIKSMSYRRQQHDKQ